MNWKKEYQKEINKIKDGKILAFAKAALDSADPMFFFAPCSSSGRFHPPEDNGQCGLLRHLIKASSIVENYARRAQFTEYELDQARCAVLIHDICKNGEIWNENTDYRHGIIGYNFLDRFYLEDKTAKENIKNAVRYHMSPWNTTLSPEKYFLLNGKGGEKKEGIIIITPQEINQELEEVKRGLMPHSIIEKCVMEADYWASRNSMSFMPRIAVNLEYRHDNPTQ
jgi:hypothetical protein